MNQLTTTHPNLAEIAPRAERSTPWRDFLRDLVPVIGLITALAVMALIASPSI